MVGEVFNVTAGFEHYKPGATYHGLLGVDASRAYVTGDFSKEGCVASLKGIDSGRWSEVEHWRRQFHEKYNYLGKLEGPYWNTKGATKLFKHYEKTVER